MCCAVALFAVLLWYVGVLCGGVVWRCCVECCMELLCGGVVWRCCVEVLCGSVVWSCCVEVLCGGVVWSCCVEVLCGGVVCKGTPCLQDYFLAGNHNDNTIEQLLAN